MRSSSPVFLAFLVLLLAAFWYDAKVASLTAAGSVQTARTAAGPAR
jgi:hypothetical protein